MGDQSRFNFREAVLSSAMLSAKFTYHYLTHLWWKFQEQRLFQELHWRYLHGAEKSSDLGL